MSTIDQIKLDKMLADHDLWRKNPAEGRRADFTNMDLRGLDLSNRDFHAAVLERTNAAGCDMRNSKFSILTYCDLSDCDLTNATLAYANMKHSNLEGAKLPPPKFSMTSDLVVYKKVFLDIFKPKPVIKLLVKADMKRVSPYPWMGGRAEKALVVEAFDTTENSFMSLYNPRFKYVLGQVAVAEDYSDDPRCIEAPGLHFFLTKEEAMNWGP